MQQNLDIETTVRQKRGFYFEVASSSYLTHRKEVKLASRWRSTSMFGNVLKRNMHVLHLLMHLSSLDDAALRQTVSSWILCFIPNYFVCLYARKEVEFWEIFVCIFFKNPFLIHIYCYCLWQKYFIITFKCSKTQTLTQHCQWNTHLLVFCCSKRPAKWLNCFYLMDESLKCK